MDKALLRPGRFDRRVIVDRPDLKGRLDILKVHAKDVCLDSEVDLNNYLNTINKINMEGKSLQKKRRE